MSYFEKLLSTIEIIYFAHGFNDVNDNIIRDTLILLEKNRLKLIRVVDSFRSDIEIDIAAIIFARLKPEPLSIEREVVLFERLFNSICQFIDE